MQSFFFDYIFVIQLFFLQEFSLLSSLFYISRRIVREASLQPLENREIFLLLPVSPKNCFHQTGRHRIEEGCFLSFMNNGFPCIKLRGTSENGAQQWPTSGTGWNKKSSATQQ